MKFRKVIGLLTTAAVMISAIPVPAATHQEDYAVRDIDFHWAEDDIELLINADIMKGYESSANPDRNITRGEFCALTARALAPNNTQKSYFADIPSSHMFSAEINALAEAKIVSGIGNGIFAPERSLTREEIMLIISRCIPDRSEKRVNFRDIASNYEYLPELRKAVSSGIIAGFEDNTFRPYDKATRAECAAMLRRLLSTTGTMSKTQAKDLAEEYIRNDLNAPALNTEYATGRAKEENSLKAETRQKLSTLDTSVQKFLSGLTLADSEINGSLGSLTYRGNLDYVVSTLSNSRNNSYDAVFTVKIIEHNNGLYVYDYTTNLMKKDRINLTWEVYSAPPDYAPDGVNIVSPSSFQVSAENLGVEKRELTGGISFYNSLTRKYMSYAAQNNYEVWPIYKTDFSLKTSDSFLNNPSARRKAIEYLVEYACEYGISGVNIDFENIYKNNRYLVTKHIRDLCTALHELGLVVSADITRREPTSANWSMCYDRDALAKSCDYIMLMAYDEYYASSTSAGSVASLDWTEESVKRTLEEVPSHKLVLGIPFYMRYFEITGNKVTSTKAISMQTAYDLIQQNNPTYTYIEADGQYKISWTKGNKNCVFWLENTDTIAKRVNLANKYSLAGIASWRRGLEISKAWSVIADNL